MSIAELSRPQMKEPVHIPPDQEARIAITNLAQQVLDLHIREVRTSPDVLLMHGKVTDKRKKGEKATKPYLPKYETVAYDRDGIVCMHIEETPVSLYLSIDNAAYPPGEDSMEVEFVRKPGAEDGYTLANGPTLANGLPAPADVVLSLAGEGQTLVELIRQA